MLAALLMGWDHQKHEGDTQTPTASKEKDEAATNVESPWMIERKGERVLWRLKAEHATQGLKTMHFTHPYLELFNESGEKITVQGEQADLDVLSHDVHFQGNVHAHFQEWSLISNSLNAEKASGDIWTKERFTATRPISTIRGRGLRIRHQTYDMWIQHDVWMQERTMNERGSTP